MANLTRWDPFRDMLRMRSLMDRFFDNALTFPEPDWQTAEWGLALDVAESEDEYVVKASLPGINPDDLEITYTDDTLTIKGEIKEEKDIEESRYHLRERRYGRFTRSIRIPSQVISDKIEANYQDGVLKLRLPKSEEVKPKRISVKSNDQPKMVEGKFESVSSKN